MNNAVVVTYQFSLLADTAPADFVAASKNLDQDLLKMPGFQYRSVAQTESGQWQDMVYWESEAHLKQADSMDQLESFARLMSVLNLETVTRTLAHVQSSAMAVTEELTEA